MTTPLEPPLHVALLTCPDATLDIVNHSASIAFPARTEGREAIADVRVRAFSRTYENVRTF